MNHITSTFSMEKILLSEYETHTAAPRPNPNHKEIHLVSVFKIKAASKRVILKLLDHQSNTLDECKDLAMQYKIATIKKFNGNKVHFGLSGKFLSILPTGTLSLYLKIRNENVFLCKTDDVNLYTGSQYGKVMELYKPIFSLISYHTKQKNALQKPQENQKKSFLEKLGFKKK